MMTALLLLVSVPILFLAVIGHRASDNATRLLRAVVKRLGLVRVTVPPSPWRIPMFFAHALLCPVAGVIMLAGPEHRRFIVANIALGQARTAIRRGVWREQYQGQIQDSLQAWVNRYEYGQFDA